MKFILHIFAGFWLALSGTASAQAIQNAEDNPRAVMALQALQQLDRRINAIGWRLAYSNAPYCQTHSPGTGLLLLDVAQYADQQAVRSALNITGPIAINAVAPDSPAAASGLKPGDDIIAIDTVRIDRVDGNDPAFADEQPPYRRIAAVNHMLDKNPGQSSVSLDIMRDGERHVITIVPKAVCPSRFQIRVSADRGASANGKMVSVTSALAEYVLDDNELAAIAAHELAHNLLRHRDRLNAQKVDRGFFGQFGKSAKRIKETEIEADRLSIWLLVNAGYDPTAAIRFWTRYGKEHGKGIFSASTHYRWKKRVKLFEEEITKIKKAAPVNGSYAPPLLAAMVQ